MDPVSQYERRVYLSLAAMVLAAAASWPLWGLSRPDRVWGLAVGVAAGVVRLSWTFLLARRLARGAGPATASRYATLRALGYLPLAVALAAGGIVPGIDLVAAAFGVFLPTAASISASVLEIRALARQDRDDASASEEAPSCKS